MAVSELNEADERRMQEGRILWLATVRPDGRPHLTPLWYVWEGGCVYVCIQSGSVKAANLAENRAVVFSLEDGEHPVIGEGWAEPVAVPWPGGVAAGFMERYEWEIERDSDYDVLVCISPRRWLTW